MRLLLLFLLIPFFLFSQTQIGNDIDGILAGDNFGSAVSVSGNGSIVAIGGNGNFEGHVRVYENISDNWVQIGNPIQGVATGDNFGSSVSLSSDGSIIAIGGPNNASIDTDSGHVRVFENISGVWTQIGSDIYGEAIGGRLGLFVNLSGDGSKLAVSGYWCCGLQHGTPGVGYTRIYENINGIWTHIGEEISTGFHGIVDIALSTDGSVVAIASPGGGNIWTSGYYSSGVKVYKNILGVWTQLGSAFGFFDWEDFTNIHGVSLTNNGSKLVIAGKNANSNRYIQVYENINEEWAQVGENINNEYSYCFNGVCYINHNKISLSENGNVMVIGGPITRIYKNNSGNWTQLGVDINEETTNEYVIPSLELSGDGSTLVIGNPLNDAIGENAGHARVYDLSALLSLEESNMLDFKLYPNPTTDQFKIVLPENQILDKINIYNNLGKFVKKAKTSVIKTSELASGLYYVEVITNQGKATKKLILK